MPKGIAFSPCTASKAEKINNRKASAKGISAFCTGFFAYKAVSSCLEVYTGGSPIAKYCYPAVFTKEKAGYSVSFPDIDSCYTSGATREEALEMAKDVLCLTLYGLEQDGKAIPLASTLSDVPHGKDAFVSPVHCDTAEYRSFFRQKDPSIPQ